MATKYKVVFFGTSEFAVPALQKLAESSGYDISTVITQPDKPAGRKQELLPSPVKIAAQKLGLKVLQPIKLSGDDLQLRADLFVVASYGKIIPGKLLEIPKYGTLNIHPSLLPKYRGPSPIQTAILNGDKETGVTIMKLDEEMDHGDIVAKSKYQITNSKIEFTELHGELAEAGAELLIQILPDYLKGKLQLVPQDHSHATYTKIITKEDARIDWTKSASEIERLIRAYESWPVAWTTLDGKRLKIYDAETNSHTDLKPGQVGNELSVGTGEGALKIIELQLEGSKQMTAGEFLRGHGGLNGKILE